MTKVLTEWGSKIAYLHPTNLSLDRHLQASVFASRFRWGSNLLSFLRRRFVLGSFAEAVV